MSRQNLAIDRRVEQAFGRGIPERFLSRVRVVPSGCWEYPTSTLPNGTRRYALLSVDGKQLALHRLAWSVSRGRVIPAKMEVRHVVCDNPPCCNPEHISIGTHAQNMADRNAKERQSRMPGESNGRAKLTESDVVCIRDRYALGGVYHRELAAQYGVGVSIIGHIVTGVAWAHVGGPLTNHKRKTK